MANIEESTRGGRILKALVDRFSNNWEQAVSCTLWSYRACPVEGLTFLPFELLFARQPPGPLALLKESWVSNSLFKPQMKHVLNYVYDIRNKLQVSLDITKREAKLAKCKTNNVTTKML